MIDVSALETWRVQPLSLARSAYPGIREVSMNLCHRGGKNCESAIAPFSEDGYRAYQHRATKDDSRLEENMSYLFLAALISQKKGKQFTPAFLQAFSAQFFNILHSFNSSFVGVSAMCTPFRVVPQHLACPREQG